MLRKKPRVKVEEVVESKVDKFEFPNVVNTPKDQDEKEKLAQVAKERASGLAGRGAILNSPRDEKEQAKLDELKQERLQQEKTITAVRWKQERARTFALKQDVAGLQNKVSYLENMLQDALDEIRVCHHVVINQESSIQQLETLLSRANALIEIYQEKNSRLNAILTEMTEDQRAVSPISVAGASIFRRSIGINIQPQASEYEVDASNTSSPRFS